MTNILAPFYNIDNVTDGIGGVSELAGAGDVVGVTIGNNTFVYGAGYNDAGIQIFDFDMGMLTPTGVLIDDASNDIRNPWDLEHFQIGGVDHLFIKGYYSLTVASIDATTGALSVVDTVTDSASTFLQGQSQTEIVVKGGTTYAVVASEVEDTISVWEIDNAGLMTEVETVRDTDNVVYELDGAENVHIADVGNNTYVFSAGYNDDGIGVWQLGNNGSLTNRDNVADDATLELNGAMGLQTAEVGGQTYLYAGGQVDNGISVFEVAANGNLTNVHNYDFGTSQFVGLYYPAYFEIREYEGAEILIAPGAFGDHLVAYSIEQDGGLVEIGRLIDSATLELDGTNYATFLEVGGTDYLLTSGFNDAGISTFEVGGDDDVVGGTDDTDFLFGFAGADLLGGQAGNDNLYGGDGDDVLSGGRNRDLLHGGKGADVLIGGAGDDTASYVGSNQAVTIDLSTGLATGGDATGDTLLSIENVIGSANNDEITGDAGKNNLIGEDGNDVIDAGDGNDRVIGGQGNDDLIGGGGNDRMKGNNGGDMLVGNAGIDRLLGGAGSDAIFGGGGDDFLFGQSGSDALRGGGGNDELDGGGGNDTIQGDAGDDIMTGSTGADSFVINDGDGADTITDFEDGTDVIDLSGHSVTGFGQISSFQVGTSLIVQIGTGGETVVMENFQQADLDASDFIFT